YQPADGSSDRHVGRRVRFGDSYANTTDRTTPANEPCNSDSDPVDVGVIRRWPAAIRGNRRGFFCGCGLVDDASNWYAQRHRLVPGAGERQEVDHRATYGEIKGQ